MSIGIIKHAMLCYVMKLCFSAKKLLLGIDKDARFRITLSTPIVVAVIHTCNVSFDLLLHISLKTYCTSISGKEQPFWVLICIKIQNRYCLTDTTPLPTPVSTSGPSTTGKVFTRKRPSSFHFFAFT